MVQDNTTGNNLNDAVITGDVPAVFAATRPYLLQIEKFIKIGDHWERADGPGFELLKPVGGKVEYKIWVVNGGTENLTDVMVSDPDLGFEVVIPELVPGGPMIFEHSLDHNLMNDWAVGLVDNTVVASGNESKVRSDTTYYFGAAPALEIDKVTIANGNEGDGLIVLDDAEVTWEYTVTNTGNVALDAPMVTDDVLGAVDGVDKDGDGFILGDDLDDNDILVGGDGVFDPGEAWVYQASGPAVDIPDGEGYATYENTGTASVEYTDDADQSVTVADEDASSYTVLKGGSVTDGEMCDFGDNIELIFFENEWDKNADSYSLFATLPAHNRYNVLFDGAEEGGEITLTIPFPFVTYQDDPVSAYSGVTLDDHCGFCLEPNGDPIAYDLAFEIGDYEDTNGDGHVGFGDTYEVVVTGLPTAGLGLVSILLEYGLEFTQAWEQAGQDANNLDDPDGHTNIVNDQDYAFGSSVADTAVEITSTNAFKPWHDHDWGDGDGDDHGDDHGDSHGHPDGGWDQGDDWTVCTDGDDREKGGKNADQIRGLEGKDKLFGGRGDDKLFGDEGNDRIRAGAGDDLVVGGEGNDLMWGGKGADTFRFRDGDGDDILRDFKPGEDVIDLSQVTAIRKMKDLKKNHMEQVGDDVEITGDGVMVTLEDVNMADLDRADFLF